MIIVSAIDEALEAALSSVPAIGRVMVSRSTPVSNDVDAFAILWLDDETANFADSRVGRDPGAAIIEQEAIFKAIVTAYVPDGQSVRDFRDSVMQDIRVAIARSPGLRKISYRYLVSRCLWFYDYNSGREEVSALLTIRVPYRTRADKPDIAVQTN